MPRRTLPPRSNPPLLELQPQRADANWFKQQIRRTDWTSSRLSKHMVPTGTTEPTDTGNKITNILKNAKTATIAEAIVFARLFSVPLAEIVRRLGYTWEEIEAPRVPIVGELQIDGYVRPQAEAEADSAPGNPAALKRTAAIRVVSHPLLPAGAIIHFEREPDGVDARTLGRWAVITAGSLPTGMMIGVPVEIAGLGSVKIAPLGLGDSKRQTVHNLKSSNLITWVHVLPESADAAPTK